jgi:5-(carboxyamino)imidazole ribonucleotide mutase
MPSGIPVATVAIDGAVNSALLAIEILSLSEPELEKKLSDKRAKDTATVLEKNKAIEDKYNN